MHSACNRPVSRFAANSLPMIRGGAETTKPRILKSRWKTGVKKRFLRLSNEFLKHKSISDDQLIGNTCISVNFVMSHCRLQLNIFASFNSSGCKTIKSIASCKVRLLVSERSIRLLPGHCVVIGGFTSPTEREARTASFRVIGNTNHVCKRWAPVLFLPPVFKLSVSFEMRRAFFSFRQLLNQVDPASGSVTIAQNVSKAFLC